jgi:hypothetical protein
MFCIVFYSIHILPSNLSNKVSFTKYLDKNFGNIEYFIIINTHKNYPILTEQITCQLEACVHHIQPVRVEAAVRFGVGHQAPSLVVVLP